MGITAYDVTLLEKALSINPEIKNVCELGSQNLYLDNSDKPPFASSWYEERGIDYTCIDLAGDNKAKEIDLSFSVPEDMKNFFDLVTDFGTSEHVVQMESFTKTAFHEGHINSIYPEKIRENGDIWGIYNCWKNKHDMLKCSGVMVNVNPKFGNWPDHGYHYYTLDFYNELCSINGYEIVVLEEHAAMGNTISGWNIVCMLIKGNDDPFMSFIEFCKLDLRSK